MSHKVLLIVGLALVVVGFLSTTPASAEPITVLNASFEDPILSDGVGSSTTLTPYSWGGLVGAYTRILNPLGLGDDPARGWADATGNGTPRGGDGINIISQAVGHRDGEHQGSCGIYQTLEDTLQAGTYTLTAAAGRRAEGTGAGDPIFEISLGATEDTEQATMLATESWDGSLVPRGEFVDKQLVWEVASDNPYIGEPLRITLGGRTTSETRHQGTRYDNVRLDFAPIPEPSTLAILIGGLLAMICLARRKDK